MCVSLKRSGVFPPIVVLTSKVFYVHLQFQEISDTDITFPDSDLCWWKQLQCGKCRPSVMDPINQIICSTTVVGVETTEVFQMLKYLLRILI